MRFSPFAYTVTVSASMTTTQGDAPSGGLLTSMIDDTTKDEVRRRTDLIELCEALGLQPKGKVARCPAHNDAGEGRPNLAIYADNVYCFRCGFAADAFDLVAKVKGCDFPVAYDFLAARLGLPLIGDLRKNGSKSAPRAGGLGYGNGGNGATVYPKPASLPATPSPTLATGETTPAPDLVRGLGYVTQGEGATPYPKPDRPPLPAALVADFATYADAWSYFDQVKTDFAVALGYDKETGRYQVAAPSPWSPPATAEDQVDQVDLPGETRRRSPRVEVFAALLARGVKAATTPAGDWLHREKGITPATQDRFGLVFLAEPRAAAGELVKTFGLDALIDLGVYGKGKDGKPYFAFKRHRLIFPFCWKGEPVDLQGRDVEATGKNDRFRNTGGANPLPYNADALLDAKATGAPIFICEGATDTLAVAQSGRLVVGIVGTGGFKAAWLPYFADLVVYLALDADEAGQKAAVAMTQVFIAAGHRPPKVVKLPAGFKDVNEFFRKEEPK